MQALELAGVFTLVGITAFLLRGRVANFKGAPIGLQLVVGFSVGALIALFMLVMETDVLPDQLEPVAQPVLLAAVVVAVLVLALRERP